VTTGHKIWGAQIYISGEDEDKRGGLKKNNNESEKTGNELNLEESRSRRTKQSHSLFNLRNRRRYSQGLPYFFCQRQRILIRKPVWIESTTRLI
jgi:hypothetical protein